MTRLNRVLLKIGNNEDLTDSDRAWLRDEIQRRQASKKRVSARSLPRRTTKAETRKARNERMEEIREAVRARSGGRCELCLRTGTEAHHVLGGPLRRTKEEVETMLWLCDGCHSRLHRGDLGLLERAHSYCVCCGMHDAAAALGTRVDKVLEARGA